MRVAVVGATGFVGAEIVRALAGRPGVTVTAVSRDNYRTHRDSGGYDVLVNAAMPSRRFWAGTRPLDDYRETVTKTAELLHTWEWKLFVQISSVSARCQLDTVYGRHKAAAEALCPPDRTRVVRLGPLYGDALTKGVLKDMSEHGTVYAAAHTRYAFTPVSWAAGQIADGLSLGPGLVEVGARNAVELRRLAERVGSRCTFEGAVDHQEFAAPVDGAPEAWDVTDFLKSQMV
ncbi:NAD-dependent epimerase/dehydratase family protein [Streptomyces sp. 150FB]|uniref:NAD-dependent epimerase/dehydratase family protein n=1 Tax=Streptomyces sp. 150FB TaxID=1576605 RepID=UPI000698D9BA|nr:NAD-dependent epimerase/dehydratase family protein [Streptomyces sp. 150FB]